MDLLVVLLVGFLASVQAIEVTDEQVGLMASMLAVLHRHQASLVVSHGEIKGATAGPPVDVVIPPLKGAASPPGEAPAPGAVPLSVKVDAPKETPPPPEAAAVPKTADAAPLPPAATVSGPKVDIVAPSERNEKKLQEILEKHFEITEPLPDSVKRDDAKSVMNFVWDHIDKIAKGEARLNDSAKATIGICLAQPQLCVPVIEREGDALHSLPTSKSILNSVLEATEGPLTEFSRKGLIQGKSEKCMVEFLLSASYGPTLDDVKEDLLNDCVFKGENLDGNVEPVRAVAKYYLTDIITEGPDFHPSEWITIDQLPTDGNDLNYVLSHDPTNIVMELVFDSVEAGQDFVEKLYPAFSRWKRDKSEANKAEYGRQKDKCIQSIKRFTVHQKQLKRFEDFTTKMEEQGGMKPPPKPGMS